MILHRYIFRTLGVYFALFTLMLTFVLSLERLLRLLEEASVNGFSLLHMSMLVFYLLPHYLGLAIPAGLFFAALMTLRRLKENSELVTMVGAGLSYSQILRSVQYLAAAMVVVMLLLTGYAQPHARYSYRSEKSAIGYGLLNIQPGVFTRIRDRVTLRTERVDEKTNTLFQFFAATQKEGTQQVMMAKEALPGWNNKEGILSFLLKDGNIVHKTPDNTIVNTRFDTYRWNIPYDDFFGRYGIRGNDERELTLMELLSEGAGVEGISFAAKEAELHMRIVRSLSLMLFAVLSLPLALIGRGRSGKAYGMIIGVFFFIFYEKVMSFGHTFAMQGHTPAWVGLWLPFLFFYVCAFLLLRRVSR